MQNRIGKVSPPALPVSAPENSAQNKTNNVLRLFFERLANAVNSLTGLYGAQFLEMPNAAYFSTANQALGTVNVGQDVEFGNTYLSSGFEINGGSNTQITALYSGVYKFSFTAQVRSNSASSKVVYIWIARNGSDLPYSAKEYQLAGSGDVRELAWDFVLDMQAGQYVEMRWTADDSDVALDATAPAAPHPGIPSAVVSVLFVSMLPAVSPTPP